MKLKEPIIFVTGNANKVAWTKRYISLPIIHQKLDLIEIQSLNPFEITEHKVKEAYKILKKPVLVEDTSLIIDYFGNFPGPFIKYFLEEIGDKKICQIVAGQKNTAHAQVTFGFYDGTTLIFGIGKLNGKIAPEPKGTYGFGWNTFFIPDGLDKTYAELKDEEMDKINVRRMAILDLEKKLA